MLGADEGKTVVYIIFFMRRNSHWVSFLYRIYGTDGSAWCYGEISPKAIFVCDWLWIRRLLQLNPRGIYILLFHSLIIVCTVGIKHRSCGNSHKSAGSLWLPGGMRPYDDTVRLSLACLHSWTGDFKLHTIHVFLFILLLLLLYD